MCQGNSSAYLVANLEVSQCEGPMAIDQNGNDQTIPTPKFELLDDVTHGYDPATNINDVYMKPSDSDDDTSQIIRPRRG